MVVAGTDIFLNAILAVEREELQLIEPPDLFAQIVEQFHHCHGLSVTTAHESILHLTQRALTLGVPQFRTIPNRPVTVVQTLLLAEKRPKMPEIPPSTSNNWNVPLMPLEQL